MFHLYSPFFFGITTETEKRMSGILLVCSFVVVVFLGLSTNRILLPVLRHIKNLSYG